MTWGSNPDPDCKEKCCQEGQTTEYRRPKEPSLMDLLGPRAWGNLFARMESQLDSPSPSRTPAKTSTACGEPQRGSTSVPDATGDSSRLEKTIGVWSCGCAVDGSTRCKGPDVVKVVPGSWLGGLSSAERKEVAVSRGLLAYFPDALALIARHSVRSNEKHNPGQPVHWSRGKSDDHEDCILRHSIAVAVNPDSLDGGVPDIICRAWRALAALQIWAEAKTAKGEKL